MGRGALRGPPVEEEVKAPVVKDVAARCLRESQGRSARAAGLLWRKLGPEVVSTRVWAEGGGPSMAS